MKKIVQLLLIIMLICTFTITGYTADREEYLESSSPISTRMTYIAFTSCNLDISGTGYSTSSASMIAYTGTDSVKISMYLQQYDGGWNTLNNWTAEANGTSVSLNKNWYVSRGYNYRILVYFYAYEGIQYERLIRTNEEWY